MQDSEQYGHYKAVFQYYSPLTRLLRKITGTKVSLFSTTVARIGRFDSVIKVSSNSPTSLLSSLYGRRRFSISSLCNPRPYACPVTHSGHFRPTIVVSPCEYPVIVCFNGGKDDLHAASSRVWIWDTTRLLPDPESLYVCLTYLQALGALPVRVFRVVGWTGHLRQIITRIVRVVPDDVVLPLQWLSQQ